MGETSSSPTQCRHSPDPCAPTTASGSHGRWPSASVLRDTRPWPVSLPSSQTRVEMPVWPGPRALLPAGPSDPRSRHFLFGAETRCRATSWPLALTLSRQAPYFLYRFGTDRPRTQAQNHPHCWVILQQRSLSPIPDSSSQTRVCTGFPWGLGGMLPPKPRPGVSTQERGAHNSPEGGHGDLILQWRRLRLWEGRHPAQSGHRRDCSQCPSGSHCPQFIRGRSLTPFLCPLTGEMR